MKVYILIRNEFSPYEFNEDHVECVYESEEVADINKPKDEVTSWDKKITYRIEEHEVKQ